MERAPPWAFAAALVGIPLVLWLLSVASPWFRAAFVDPYLWDPIAHDEGYNPVNTALFVVLILLLALWAYRVLRHHGEHVTVEVVVGALPLALAGSLLRVLEDSDFFAPFGTDHSCLGPGLDRCLGSVFVNPVLFTLVGAAVVGLGRLAFQSTLVSRRAGPVQGLRFYVLSILAILSLYGALWAADPTQLQLVPSPLPALLGALVGFGVVARLTKARGEVPWGPGLLGFSLIVTLPLLYLFALWMSGGTASWHPTAPTRPWIIIAFIVAPTLLVAGVAMAARAFTGPVRKEKGKALGPRRAILFLVYLLLLMAAFLFAASVSLRDVVERGDRELSTFGYLAFGVLLVPIGVWFARRSVRGGLGTHPAFAAERDFLNRQIVWAQFADALMTGIALDVYGTSEKHVLPKTLIQWVREWGLAPPLGTYPAATAMIPFKLILAFVFIWLMDVRLRDWFRGREDLSLLFKACVAVSALAPALRDVLRISMGV